MALLSERQQTAQALAREIIRMGAWVVSPPGDERIRFQVLDKDRNAILEKLGSWNWSPVFVGTHPRICPDGWKLTSVYQIELPPERQPIVDDRQPIMGELATEAKRKTPEEVLQMRKYQGWK